MELQSDEALRGWKAPIAIGTGLGMSLAFTKGAQPVASLYTQGLDIVYAF